VNSRLGIELGTRTVRGVRFQSWGRTPPRVVEVDWDPESPAEAVAALRQELGPARRIAVALDLPLLFAKRVKLPPLPPAEQRAILRLEPERFFAVRSEDLVVAVAGDANLVFAARDAALAGWIAAFEDLAPVDLVEPGPMALTRALARSGVQDCLVLLDRREDGVGLVEIRAGRVVRVRRVYGDLDDVAAATGTDGAPAPIYLTPWNEDRVAALAARLGGQTVQPVPAVAHVPAPFLSAYGAALAIGQRHDMAATLVAPELAVRIGSRRRREVAVAALACAAAVVFALTSLDAWRARGVRGVERELAALKQRAAPALALQSELEALGREVQVIRQVRAERSDPLRVLLALSKQLPAGAYVRGLRYAGVEWQVDGHAPNAARLTAQLGGAPEFKEVRFLSATNRVTVGDRTYESFALAFRYVPAP
jgi:hypothetical protein